MKAKKTCLICSFLKSGIHKSKAMRKRTCIPNFKEKKSVLYLIHDGMSIITRKPKSDSYKCASHLGKDDTKFLYIN